MHRKLIVIFLTICAVESAKILGIFPTPSLSHYNLGFRLMRELVARGHQVTVVNPFPQETPIANFTDIPVESVSEVLIDLRKELYNREELGLVESNKFVHNMGYKLTEQLLSHENFQKLLKSHAKYDLIILEYIMNDATLGIAQIFNAPIVLFSTLPSSVLTNELFANPAPSSYVPNILTTYIGDMDFGQRFTNLAINTFDHFYKQYYMLPLHNDLLKKYISPNLDVIDVIHNASLILLNSHPSVSDSVPHTPNMIEIGGFHITPTEKLPSDLQSFMDEATEGVVLVSMGSNLKSSYLDQGIVSALLNAFSKIKQKVLWKFEDDLAGLPSNVKLVKWYPQQDILAHSNTKAFISRGGMLSTIEAVYYGVPMIGIPVYGSQKGNIARAVKNGFAVSVPYQEVSEEKLTWALNEILNDTKYASTVKTRSKIMRDQVVKPLDSAMYWIEYVIRHNGAEHLQSAGIHLSWYKRNIIDIIIILAIIEIILFIVFYYIIKHIIHHITSRNKNRLYKKYERLENKKGASI